MDTSVLHSLATVISSTIDAFLAAHDETHVHSLTLKYCPANEDATPYCEMSVSQTVTVVQRHEYAEADPELETDPTTGVGHRVLKGSTVETFAGFPRSKNQVWETPAEPEEAAPTPAHEPIREATPEERQAFVNSVEQNRKEMHLPPLSPEGRTRLQAAADALIKREQGES